MAAVCFYTYFNATSYVQIDTKKYLSFHAWNDMCSCMCHVRADHKERVILISYGIKVVARRLPLLLFCSHSFSTMRPRQHDRNLQTMLGKGSNLWEVIVHWPLVQVMHWYRTGHKLLPKLVINRINDNLVVTKVLISNNASASYMLMDPHFVNIDGPACLDSGVPFTNVLN